MRVGRWGSVGLGCLFATVVVAAQEAAPPSPPEVFEMPSLQARYAVLQAQSVTLFKRGQYAQAEAACREALRLVPYAVASQYNLACTLARQGKSDEALQALDKAVAMGFNNAQKIEKDEDFAGLRGREDFQAIVKRAPAAKADPAAGWKYSVKPTPVEDGVAAVDAQNTLWDPPVWVFRSLFKFPERTRQPIVNGLGEAGLQLRRWYAAGTAAGNLGDLYDNHDSGHSVMDYRAFPQLSRIEFAEAVKKRHLHHGVQLSFLYNAPTLGNSSTAVVHGPLWRSQPRHALTHPLGPQHLVLQYASNHLYFYPEHRDHDPGHNGDGGKGYGDVFPANTPYLLISQGSSGSDRPFLEAVAAAMAAFRPEVKAQLVRTGTLMAAVQAVFRQSNKMVQKPEDYLTGKAHPTVFDAAQIDLLRMVHAAHEITLDTLPPWVQIEVVQEDPARRGVDYFDAAEGERLFDTPCAIARIARSLRYTRRMVVSAEKSRDPQKKPLQYHWVLLRGDADRVRITPRGPSGASAEIAVSYHPRRPIQPGAGLESNRVDIGVFASNGQRYSPPAFVSVFFLDNHTRTYDAQQRIAAVDYADPVVKGNYVDPLLDCRKDWRDEYHYDAAGQLQGWTRIRGKTQQQFTAAGALITRTDGQGRPLETKPVRYVAKAVPNQPSLLEQQLAEEGERPEEPASKK